jgi:hypothetical protein
MPTGYTAGILDGKIKTFPEFAKTCMRAFGATIHMRDDDLDKEYEPRTPSDYYSKELNKAKKLLNQIQILSDSKIITEREKELKKDREYHLKAIDEAKQGEKNLKSILKDVEKWNPPTNEHLEFKKFMIQQINSTIDFDCKTKYHDEKLIEITNELNNLNADHIRSKIRIDARHNLEYYTKERNEELKRCEDSNKWVTDLLTSLQV